MLILLGVGIWLTLPYHTVHHPKKSGQELKQGRNLEAGADAEAMRVASYWLVLHALLSLHYDGCRTTGPGMAPPSVGGSSPINH